MKMKNSIAGLDLLRFLSAVFVSIFHLFYWVSHEGSTPYKITNGAFDFQKYADFTWFGWVGVQIFFVLSGFVIAFSAHNASPSSFIKSRVLRLFPAALVCASITLFVVLLAGHVAPFEALLQWFRSVFFSPVGPWIDGVYWTLGIEISFYSLVLVFLIFDRFDWVKYVISIVGLVSVVYNVYHYCIYIFTGDLRFMGGRAAQLLLVRHGCEFAIGVLLWQISFVRRDAKWIGVLLFMLVGGVMDVACEAVLKAPFGGEKWPIPAAVWLGSLLFIYTSVSTRFSSSSARFVSKAFRPFGLATYPFYLIHQLVGAALALALHSLGLDPVVSVLVSIVSLLLLSFVIALSIEPFLRRKMIPLLNGVAQRLPMSWVLVLKRGS